MTTAEKRKKNSHNNDQILNWSSVKKDE